MESVLRKKEGVITAEATFWKKQAVVEYDPDKITPRELIEAVNGNSPYRASRLEGSYRYMSLTIEGDGDNRSEALNAVADVLHDLPGVEVSALDPPNGKLYLEYATDKISVENIVETATSKTGYKLVAKSGDLLEKEEAAIAEERGKLFEKFFRRLMGKDGQ